MTDRKGRPEDLLPERARAGGTRTATMVPADETRGPEVTTVSAPMLTADESAEDSVLFDEDNLEMPPATQAQTLGATHADESRHEEEEDEEDDDEEEDEEEDFLSGPTVAEVEALGAIDANRFTPSVTSPIDPAAERTVLAPVDFDALNRDRPPLAGGDDVVAPKGTGPVDFDAPTTVSATALADGTAPLGESIVADDDDAVPIDGDDTGIGATSEITAPNDPTPTPPWVYGAWAFGGVLVVVTLTALVLAWVL